VCCRVLKSVLLCVHEGMRSSVCCRVLQSVAECCSALQCVAVRCIVCVRVCVVQYFAVYCSVLQGVAEQGNV